jgi:phage head maturation protease
MAGGAIDLRFDPLVGAWFVARATTLDARRLRTLVDNTFGCGVSVTFSRAMTKDVTTSRGVIVREIQSATLHDISLVPSAGDARALYEGARAYLAASDTPDSIAAAFARAKDWATRYGLSRI